MGNSVILTRNLIKDYNGKVRALEDVNLSVEAGQWLSIMGPSGSGKTTLLNILGCLDKPTLGSVQLAGTDISALGVKELTLFRRENVGLIFQQFYLIPYLTALENVMLAQYFHSMADEDEARKALEEVGLKDRMDHLPSQLSGGEQQRVCIARALINQPKIILADEPTGNLDQGNEETVIELLRELHATGSTLIVVTHDWEIGKLAQRQIRLEHGRVVSEN
jgi:putative ABC transport system ATP-binding protein